MVSIAVGYFINLGRIRNCFVPKGVTKLFSLNKNIHDCLTKKQFGLFMDDLASIFVGLGLRYTHGKLCDNKSSQTLGHPVCLLARNLYPGCLPCDISLKTSVKPRALQS